MPEIPQIYSLCFETALYEPQNFATMEVDSVKYLLESDYSFDAYCIWCEKESVFSEEDPDNNANNWQYAQGTHYYFQPSCVRNRSHRYYFDFMMSNKMMEKVGQWPSVATMAQPLTKRFRPVAGNDLIKEFNCGIGLHSHGVGIGSFVYLRRVFEKLVANAAHVAKAKDSQWDQAKYEKSRMEEKILLLQDHLPKFLVEARKIYSILSIGIHELDEQKCLSIFPALRTGIEMILEEELATKEAAKREKEAKDNIAKIQQDLAKQNEVKDGKEDTTSTAS